jgi:hypothetical protein
VPDIRRAGAELQAGFDTPLGVHKILISIGDRIFSAIGKKNKERAAVPVVIR